MCIAVTLSPQIQLPGLRPAWVSHRPRAGRAGLLATAPLPAPPPQVKRLLKKQVVRIMSCSPDTRCSRHRSVEDPGRKGGARAKSEAGSASPEGTPDGSASPVEMQDEGPEEAQEASEQLPPFLLKEGGDDRLQSAEQDADDEAADDTDDTSSVTSSASSTTSSQSGSGTSRKKSIPLSIKNLKRKHKRKKSKITRDFKPGDRYTQGLPPAEGAAGDHPHGTRTHRLQAPSRSGTQLRRHECLGWA